MADKSSGAGKDTSQNAGARRPHATLDLKATEIKVTPLAVKQAGAAEPSSNQTDYLPPASSVPLPLVASAYALASSNAAAAEKAQPQMTPASNAARSSKPDSTAGSAASPGNEKVVVKKRGGFFSHLAASIVGGLIVLGGLKFAPPELGLNLLPAPAQNSAEVAAFADRLAALEKSKPEAGASNFDASQLEQRLAAVEKSAAAIPALSESQSRLVADTKAALAGAASDAGSPELITRLGQVEGKLKALADAGSSDPNAGRLEQLAALTGKVTDLETSLSTKLGELRKGVTQDVDQRLQSATAASEAARAGTERLDREITGLRSDAVKVDERIAGIQTEGEKSSSALKIFQDQAAALKNDLARVESATAKPADVTAALAPLTDRTAALEKSVGDVLKAEQERKANAERVVLALELQNLKRALDSGGSYAAELAQVKRVAGNAIDLAPLTKLQDSGVPPASEIAKDFRAAANSAIDSEQDTQPGSVVDKLWASAKSVVRVRKVDHLADDKSTEAIVGRMQLAMEHGKLADVLEQAKDLSLPAQEAARPFLDKVAARVSVDNALAKLEADLKTAMADTRPAGTTQP